MAESNVAVANRALQKLGAKRISSLTQDNKNARAMNVAYEPVKRRLLRQYTWSFAIKRASVAVDSDQTKWGEANRYAQPIDFLRLLRNKEIDYTDVSHDWAIEGRFIVTYDSAPLQFRYIQDVVDPTLYDATFDEALATLLAFECCEELTQSNTKKKELASDMVEIIKEARLTNAIEKGAQEQVQSTWLDARR